MTTATRTTGAPAGSMARIADALRGRSFRWWFLGQLTSASGSMTQAVAVSWFVLAQTGNAEWLAAVTVCNWGPMLLLGPWAGVLVDRLDRRRLLLVTQALLLAVGLTLGLLAVSGRLNLWLVLGATVLTGVVTTVDSPARQVYVVDLVGREAVASAVGLWEVALNGSRVIGPGIGGLLLATSGPAACFAANALSYCAPLFVLARLIPPSGAEQSAGTRPGHRVRARDGFSYAWRTPVIRALLPMAAASGLIFSMSTSLPALAVRTLHLGGGGYGALMAAFGAGGLVGALLAASRPSPDGVLVRWLALAAVGSVLAVAWAPWVPLAFAAMVATGATSIWFIACANTLAQLRTTAELRGRVMGLWGASITGTLPVTSLLLTWTAQHVGPREGFSISAVALAGATLLGWRGLRE
ncbi:MFS transporter [Kitasatospora sp. NPDC058965]|uniref:MFS transporter n=1 Tax=Kitasatospora sp. NPDC058965 TaxID=3346682 RepID=UPI00368420B3